MKWTLYIRKSDGIVTSKEYDFGNLALRYFADAITQEDVTGAVVIVDGSIAYGEAVLAAYGENWSDTYMTIPDWAE